MAVIAGTIRGLTCVSRVFTGFGSREGWLITADYAAYSGAADTASLVGIGAAIDATCRDGKVSTLRSGACAFPGADTAKQLVFFTGTAVQALTVSSDNLTGQLSDVTGSELAASTALDSELGIIAFVDRA
jgi:hypothetical protein